MPFPKPTLKELAIRIEQDMLARVKTGTGILRRSMLKVFSKVIAGAIYLTYGFTDFISQQLFITTAESEYLEEHGKKWGKTLKASTPASGTIIIAGAEGGFVPTGSLLQNADDIEYATLVDVTIPIIGSITVNIEATENGLAGNQLSGEILTLLNPILDVNDFATVDTDGLNGGTDVEKDDSFRSRILQRIQNGPEIGRLIDYETWARETIGVSITRVWAFKGYAGAGSIGIFFVNDLASPIFPTVVDVGNVQNNIDVKAPLDSIPIVYSPVGKEIGLVLTVSPNDSQVNTNVMNSLIAMFTGETNVGTDLFKTQITTAIGRAIGEVSHVIDSMTVDSNSHPVADVLMGNNELPILTALTINGSVYI